MLVEAVRRVIRRIEVLTSHGFPSILWYPRPQATLPLDDIPPHLLYLSFRTRRRKPLRKKIMHRLDTR